MSDGGRGGGRRRHPDQENTLNSFRIWNHTPKPLPLFLPLLPNTDSTHPKNQTPEIVEAPQPALDPEGSAPPPANHILSPTP